MKLKVCFFGTPEYVIPVLTALIDNFQVVGIVTAPDTIQGRKKTLTPSPVKSYAHEMLTSATILTPQSLKQKDVSEELQKLNADLFVVAAYGKLIPHGILSFPRLGALNIHPSLLPKYRGPSPIQTTLLHGDETGGITVIKMDEQMDHGPIVTQWEFPLQNTDTFESLHKAMFLDASTRLPEIIRKFATGELTPQPQSEDQASYCKLVTKESGFIDLQNPPSPLEIDRLIRAYYPWPTAWTKVTLHKEEKMLKLLPDHMVQLEGGKPMSIKDINNGYPQLKEVMVKLFGENKEISLS